MAVASLAPARATTSPLVPWPALASVSMEKKVAPMAGPRFSWVLQLGSYFMVLVIPFFRGKDVMEVEGKKEEGENP